MASEELLVNTLRNHLNVTETDVNFFIYIFLIFFLHFLYRSTTFKEGRPIRAVILTVRNPKRQI